MTHRSRSLLAALLLSLPALAGPAAPFRDARLSGRSRDAAGVTFTLGAVRYALASGRLFEIAAADGAACGLFFEGEGTLAWSEPDPEAARVFADDARRLGGFDVKRDTLGARFGRASFWLSPGVLVEAPAFSGEPGAAPAAAFAAHRARFVRDRVTPPALGLAGARAGLGPFASALLEGKRDLVHEVDGVFSGEEVLATVAEMEAAPTGFVDWRLARAAARHTVGKGLHEPPAAPARLTELSVDVREEDGGEGRLEVEESYLPVRAVKALALVLSSDTVDKRGLGSRPTKLQWVKDAAGRELPFAFEKDALLVLLPEEAKAGEPVRLRFAYTAHFFEPRLESRAWELALGQGWYPAPDAYRTAALFTYRAVVRAKKPLVPLTSGETVRRGEEEGWNLVASRMERPVPVVGVIAGPFSLVSETKEGFTLTVASYSIPKEKATARLAELFRAYRALFEARLGPFPWRELTLAETSVARLGQATPELVLLPREAFALRPRRSRGDAILPEGIDRQLAHELAHAWFGYGVWGATAGDQWIEEGIPELLSVWALEALGDPAEAKVVEATWRTRAKDSAKEAPVVLANDMTDEATLKPSHEVGRDRANLVYMKSATILLALRKELGEERFLRALGTLLAERSGPIGTAELAARFSRDAGRDLAPWFARFVYGREMP